MWVTSFPAVSLHAKWDVVWLLHTAGSTYGCTVYWSRVPPLKQSDTRLYAGAALPRGPICLFSAYRDHHLLPGCMHRHTFLHCTALHHIADLLPDLYMH